MNREILFARLSGVDIPTGNVKAWYDFASGNGDLVYNSLYSNTGHFITGDETKIRGDIYPGVSIGLTDSPPTGAIGSGKFGGTDLVRVGYEVDLPDWTVFFKIYEDLPGVDQTKGRILLSSVPSGDTNMVSGFTIGINGANRLFYEHTQPNGNREIFTLDKELGKQNLISASKSNNTYYLSLGYHNLATQSHTHQAVHLQEGEVSKSWHLGGMYDSSSKFTGFSGFMSDFLLMSGTYDTTVMNEVADSFYITGFTPAGFYTEVGGYYHPVRDHYETEIVIGSGITGYADPLPNTVHGPYGESVDLYVPSGLTGEFTQLRTVFVHETGNVARIEEVWKPAGWEYDYNNALDYAKDSIVFNNLTLDKRIETYSSSIYSKDLNITPSYIFGRKYFQLDNKYSEQNLSVNLYVNGAAQMSGIDYSISGEKILSDSHTREYVDTDIVVYDKVFGSHFYSGYTGAVGIPNTGFSVDLDEGSDYDRQDLYYVGHKLIKGLDWEHSGDSIFNIESGALQHTGYLMWLPRYSGVDQNLSGLRTGTLSCPYSGLDFNLISEQIWSDGLRLYPENRNAIARGDLSEISGYTKTASNSLLNSCNIFINRVGYVYNNETGYFNT